MPTDDLFAEIVDDLEKVLRLGELISTLLERFYSIGQSFIFSAPVGSDFSQLQISFSALPNAEFPQVLRAIVIGVTVGGDIKFFGFLNNGEEILRLNNYPEFREDLDNWISAQAVKTYSEITSIELQKPVVKENEQDIYKTLYREVKTFFETKTQEDIFVLITDREKLVMLCFRDSNGSPKYICVFSISLGGTPVFRNTSYQFYYDVVLQDGSKVNGVRFVGDLAPGSFIKAMRENKDPGGAPDDDEGDAPDASVFEM